MTGAPAQACEPTTTPTTPAEITAGTVVLLDLHDGTLVVARFTGKTTEGGRLRFQRIDRRLYEREHLTVDRGRVKAVLAADLVGWLRMCETTAGAGVGVGDA